MTDAQLCNAVTASFVHLEDALWAAHDPIRPYLLRYLTELMPGLDVRDGDLAMTWRVAREAAREFLAGAPSDFFTDELVLSDARDSSLMTFEDGMIVYCEPKRLTDLRTDSSLVDVRPAAIRAGMPVRNNNGPVSDIRLDSFRVGTMELDAPYC